MDEGHRTHAGDVADAIEANAHNYDQEVLYHLDGTPACVAGWSVAVARAGTRGAADTVLFTGVDDREDGDEEFRIEDAAMRNLGLTVAEARIMFETAPYGTPAKAGEAVEMLRRRGRTGEVRWPARRED